MDRIEELMKNAKPRVGAPGASAGSDSSRSVVTSTDPNVVPMTRRAPVRRGRHNAVRAAAATLVAAAAVVAAVAVGSNLVSQPAPGPAQTGVPSEAASTGPTPGVSSTSPVPATSRPATIAPATAPATTAAEALTTGGVACTMANVDQQRNDQQRAIIPVPANERRYYTVLGCADGWLAYSTSDEGAMAMKLDGGNAWFHLAKLQNGRFLCDYQQVWSSVFDWDSQATNNQGLTAQQAMDQEFIQKGIPVKLRPQLVGEGPAVK